MSKPFGRARWAQRSLRMLSLIALCAGPGCLGSCESCLGSDPGSDLEAGLAKIDGADQARSDRADQAAPEGGSKESGSRLARFPAANLVPLEGAGLPKAFAALGFVASECLDQDAPTRGQRSVHCRYERDGQPVEVDWFDFDDPARAEANLLDLLMAGEVLIHDGRRVLALRWLDLRAAAELVSGLSAPAIPTTADARKRLEAQGFQVTVCERLDQQELECEVQRAGLEGQVQWTSASEEELGDLPDADALDAAPDELLHEDEGAGRMEDRVQVSAQLVDRKASRDLLERLAPGSRPPAGLLVGLVVLAATKADGRDWDPGEPQPDPYLTVGPLSLRAERCQDSFECTFVIPESAAGHYAFFDADPDQDDPAGETDCKPGRVCETEAASLELRPIW